MCWYMEVCKWFSEISKPFPCVHDAVYMWRMKQENSWHLHVVNVSNWLGKHIAPTIVNVEFSRKFAGETCRVPSPAMENLALSILLAAQILYWIPRNVSSTVNNNLNANIEWEKLRWTMCDTMLRVRACGRVFATSFGGVCWMQFIYSYIIEILALLDCIHIWPILAHVFRIWGVYWRIRSISYSDKMIQLGKKHKNERENTIKLSVHTSEILNHFCERYNFISFNLVSVLSCHNSVQRCYFAECCNFIVLHETHVNHTRYTWRETWRWWILRVLFIKLLNFVCPGCLFEDEWEFASDWK